MKNLRKFDIDAHIAISRKKSRDFREAYDAARLETLIARKLAKLREQSGISQTQLAKKLGTSQAAVSRLENPTYQGHSLKMLVRYAEALGKQVNVSFSPLAI